MTILVINNYYKIEYQEKVNQIAHALRKVGENRHEIWSFSQINEKGIHEDFKAIVLSGSTAHLQNQNHMSMYNAEIELVKQVKIPVLGICFGHQLIGKAFGSQIHALQHFIRGFINVQILKPNEIFSSWKKGTKITLNQNHIDCITNLPESFVRLAESESCKIEAMKHESRPIYGVQAHIERATHEEPHGWQILENFISNVARV